MAELLPTDATQPISVFVVELGSARYQITYTWHDRLNGWYFDLDDLEGNAIVRGRRLEPGTGPLWGMVREVGALPDVALVVVGPSPYKQSDLGNTLFVVVLTDEDLTVGQTTTAQPTVILDG